MGHPAKIFLLTALVLQVYSAPQLLDLSGGKLGVNFGGYHAAVGLGGLVGGGGPAGGLFAEAGTPHGQAAKAGLGGAVNGNSGTAGGLYAGATAGGGIKASAGLAGGVTEERTSGTGYAEAQAGKHYAASGLGGETSVDGASGFTFSGTKSFGGSTGVIKEKEVVVQPIETIKPIHKVQTEINVDANDLNAVPLSSASKTKLQTDVKVNTKVQPTVVVEEVYAQPPPVLVEKHIVRTHYKPRRTHFRKTAYIGGYLGSDVPPPPPPPTYKYIATNPVIEKRIDVGVAGGAGAEESAQGYGTGGVGYTKQVTYQRNPTFFADIFNIPISTLRAVGNFLGNAAANTNVSVQKSASLHADSDSESPKHASSSSVSSSETQLSIQTPPVSKVIDDIFAIPINTLGAVNKFLENNVGKKRVQVSQDGAGEPTKIRLGPHARRRANKHVVVVENSDEKSDMKSEEVNQ